ncbi:MAG: glycine betaine ABC transporter substrate-binding protein [bacterium]|jgi:osmoprotectant transport system substrate-binding protein
MKGKTYVAALGLLLAVVLLVTGCGGSSDVPQKSSGTIFRVGSQGYAEVEIQAEIAKAIIEAKTDHKVEHVQNLGSAMATLQATTTGDLDMHISFSGTHFLGTFEQELTPEWRDPDKVWQYVHDRLLEEYELYAFEPYGYNNVYGLAVPRATAEELNLKTTSDIVPYAADMVLATDQTFQDYPGQGYKEFCETYGFQFKEAIPMDFGLMYRALGTGEVEAAVVYTTDGRNIAGDLVILEDDQHFNPPYYGMLVSRSDILEQYPEVKEALSLLSGLIDTETMMELNARVDVDEEEPSTVAQDFLKEKGLI